MVSRTPTGHSTAISIDIVPLTITFFLRGTPLHLMYIASHNARRSAPHLARFHESVTTKSTLLRHARVHSLFHDATRTRAMARREKRIVRFALRCAAAHREMSVEGEIMSTSLRLRH